MKNYFLWILLFLFCSDALAVINGVTVSENKSVIGIYVGESFCTGTKVGASSIITASHCFDASTINSKELIITYSPKPIEDDYKLLQVEKIHIHESFPTGYESLDNFDQHFAFDVAVLNIISDEEFAERPSAKLNLEPVKELKKEAYFYGYGCQESLNNLDDFIPELKKGVTQLVDHTFLRTPHGELTDFYTEYTEEISSFQNITLGANYSSEYSSVCMGDSGGPLFYEDKLIGINSYYTFMDYSISDGTTDSGVSKLNLHTKLSKISDWLKMVVK